MPVILSQKDERLWLRTDLSRDKIQSLLLPYDASEMEAYPVSKMVNQIGSNTDRPEVTARQEYPDLPDLDIY